MALSITVHVQCRCRLRRTTEAHSPTQRSKQISLVTKYLGVFKAKSMGGKVLQSLQYSLLKALTESQTSKAAQLAGLAKCNAQTQKCCQRSLFIMPDKSEPESMSAWQKRTKSGHFSSSALATKVATVDWVLIYARQSCMHSRIVLGLTASASTKCGRCNTQLAFC